ncbi:peptide MFS transporter [Chiayiivirga flava]|uniref:POT family proton-dependent oligopeptide transporter n=1 Tax=Chiayiivirga flava TaxID=659595 RepID=A0A7W8D786_9GAMM|nr:peptide MFS transporter [Chiayiivirga flava]MBB5209189.1 POT family proton-dependent oligopeptide transporter [Chiayiivirga flava]
MAQPISDRVFTPPPPGDFMGHPRALWMLFGAEFWERFAYYGMRALLAVYVATTFFGLLPEGEAKAQASLTYGAYTALIYATGIFGGFIADRYLGYRPSLWVGGLLMAAGLFLLLIPQLDWFLLGLAVIVVGNGLFKPNISTMVGMLYAPGDARRDSGFTIFYMGINAGGALAPLICGTLVGAHFGYKWGFFTAGLGMILGLVMFQALVSWLGPIGAAPKPERNWNRAFKVTAGCIALVPVVYLMLSQAKIVGWILMGLMLVLAVYFIGSGMRSGDKVQMHRYIAMLLLFLAKILFWGMFEQAGSSLNFFAKDYVDAPFDFTLFQSANPVFIILLAPLFAWLWPKLETRNINPSIPRKFAIALVLVAIGFTTLVLTIQHAMAGDGRIAWQMLALAYAINTMGELCLSPIGLSMVTKLAAPKETGMAMGAWFLCTAIGNYFAGAVASVASGGSGATGLAQYAETYTHIAYAGFGFGVLLMLFAPLVNRLMHGVK